MELILEDGPIHFRPANHEVLGEFWDEFLDDPDIAGHHPNGMWGVALVLIADPPS